MKVSKQILGLHTGKHLHIPTHEKKNERKPEVERTSCDSRIWEAGKLLQVQNQPELHRETLSQLEPQPTNQASPKPKQKDLAECEAK